MIAYLLIYIFYQSKIVVRIIRHATTKNEIRINISPFYFNFNCFFEIREV